MGRRDTSRDGFRNKFELHSLTHFGWLWSLVQKNQALTRWVNRKLINLTVYKVPTRPRAFSTMAEYSSWDSLTDRSWLGRHLPADPEFNNPSSLPPIDEVVDLFRMRGTDSILSPKSTVLFAYFVQWFSDGFLRVMSDPADDKSVDPVDVKPKTGDPTVRLRTTSNHHIDLSTVYGITSAATKKLRSGLGGKLKSQIINGEEYPPFFYQEARAYPNDDIINPDLEGAYQPSLLERRQPPERKAKLFATGVDRGNVQIGFVALNALCLREHNRLCDLMAERHPGWDDERLFQTARNTVIAIIARIVVEEYINHIAPYHFEFVLDPLAFQDERWYRLNWMTVEFSMVYRWHMALPSWLRHGGVNIPMNQSLFNNEMLIKMGLGALFEEASSQPASRIGLRNTPDFLLHLEKTTIAWGRETQLPRYNDYREYCRYPRVTDFDQITGEPELQRRLKEVYDHVDNIEFYPGIMAEDVRPGSALPPLIGRLIGIDAFSQAYTSPLFAEHIFNEATFSEIGWQAIQETAKLEQLVHRNLPGSDRKCRVTFDLASAN